LNSVSPDKATTPQLHSNHNHNIFLQNNPFQSNNLTNNNNNNNNANINNNKSNGEAPFSRVNRRLFSDSQHSTQIQAQQPQAQSSPLLINHKNALSSNDTNIINATATTEFNAMKNTSNENKYTRTNGITFNSSLHNNTSHHLNNNSTATTTATTTNRTLSDDMMLGLQNLVTAACLEYKVVGSPQTKPLVNPRLNSNSIEGCMLSLMKGEPPLSLSHRRIRK
jgi:hypothetical protein